MRASLREVLESVTLADLASGNLPEQVTKLSDSKDAWQSR
jgi:DNA-binding IscR family transcriptional regulator